MKPRKLAVGVMLAMAVIVALCLAGCATTNTPGRILATATLTVDSTMKGWAAWVAAGQSTLEQEAKVQAAYEKYQATEKLAENAYVVVAKTGDKTAWETAIAAMNSCQADLLALIQKFQGKENQ